MFGSDNVRNYWIKFMLQNLDKNGPCQSWLSTALRRDIINNYNQTIVTDEDNSND